MKKLRVPKVYSQRDSKWEKIPLGHNTSPVYSIGNYGCLITCLGCYLDKTPPEINDILKANGGFTSGSGNFIWSKCTALGLNQTYVSPKYTGPVTDQGIAKIKELINEQLPLLCEVDFNPSTISEEMHFVLIVGYDNDSIYAVDPWTGSEINLDVYGGENRAIIQFRTYDKKLEFATEENSDLMACKSQLADEIKKKDDLYKEKTQELLPQIKELEQTLKVHKDSWNKVAKALNTSTDIAEIVGAIANLMDKDYPTIIEKLEKEKSELIEKVGVLQSVVDTIKEDNIACSRTVHGLEDDLKEVTKKLESCKLGQVLVPIFKLYKDYYLAKEVKND